MDNGPDGSPGKPALGPSPPSAKSAGGHRRTPSGNLFSRLNFLRSLSSDDRLNNAHAAGHDQQDGTVITSGATGQDAATTNGYRSAMASVQGAVNGRKRKTSLRKTALLGTGRRTSLPLQRKTSLKQSQSQSQSQSSMAEETTTNNADNPSQDPDAPRLRQSFSYESLDAASSSDSASWSNKQQELVLDTSHDITGHVLVPSAAAPVAPSPSDLPPTTSPATPTYASTTDEDEGLSFSRRPIGAPQSSTLALPGFVPRDQQQPLARRRSNKQSEHAVSPLSSSLSLDAYLPTPVEEELDYGDTEWWGWVVLIVTWVAFVVGMGSCFEVWSWAWDVGQTPYAPPELEDDPTLPIVGYYPALITLTAVMAWVWVVVAWVGIKYFKHATIQGDDM